MVITAASSLSLGASKGHLHHVDGSSCSTSYGVASNRFRSSFECFRSPDLSHMSFRSRYPLSKPTPFRWSSGDDELCLWRASVAADYSDSFPDSSKFTNYRGYHPLEEVEASKSFQKTKLTPAETARTTMEANSTALLIFPGTVHLEPHEQISWAEFPYVVDMYGDVFFSISDEKNILQNPGTDNLVNALFDLDLPTYESKLVANEYGAFGGEVADALQLDDERFEAFNYESPDAPVNWGMPDLIHPIYFAKRITEIIDVEYERKMDHPSNGVSVVGCLHPVFGEEELYVRRDLFCCEDTDYGILDWKDMENLTSSSKSSGTSSAATFYRLDFGRIELFLVHGAQTTISLQDFLEAEPDPLLDSSRAILEHITEGGGRCNVELKALCEKKGLYAERAHLIAVDSFGIDVRIFSGAEVRTHRFPFKARAMTKVAAEKQIQQLLFPRARRKKYRSQSNTLKESKAL